MQARQTELPITTCHKCGDDFEIKTDGAGRGWCARCYRLALNKNRVPVASEKVPRNEKCPCGSGKKYKNCCL